jgi:hypothetical protein
MQQVHDWKIVNLNMCFCKRRESSGPAVRLLDSQEDSAMALVGWSQAENEIVARSVEF